MGAAKSSVGAAPVTSLKVATEPENHPTPLQAKDIDTILSEGGFMQLFKVLEAARKEMEIDRKAVYIDEESAEVLELLKKKAKIKANVLVSYLLQEFFSRHKELIQELVEKRSNKLLD
jgi:hypothetical protein